MYVFITHSQWRYMDRSTRHVNTPCGDFQQLSCIHMFFYTFIIIIVLVIIFFLHITYLWLVVWIRPFLVLCGKCTHTHTHRTGQLAIHSYLTVKSHHSELTSIPIFWKVNRLHCDKPKCICLVRNQTQDLSAVN